MFILNITEGRRYGIKNCSQKIPVRTLLELEKVYGFLLIFYLIACLDIHLGLPNHGLGKSYKSEAFVQTMVWSFPERDPNTL